MREPVRKLLLEIGDTSDFDCSALPGGRNNRAFKITSGKQCYFLKSFHPEAARIRQTYAREADFLRYAEGTAPGWTPRLLNADPEHFLLLTDFLDAERFTGRVTQNHIETAAQWIHALNRGPFPPDLWSAADGCRCNADHFHGVRRRLNLLRQAALQYPELSGFPERLEKDFQNLETACSDLAECDGVIASPSDFGFHNVLIRGGRLFFVDFEYAGLDDPAKLICDFFCQPDFPVSFVMLPFFMGKAFPEKVREKLTIRVNALYPLHRIKWACILLNELLRERSDARKYAGLPEKEVHMLVNHAEKYYSGSPEDPAFMGK